MEMGLGLGTPIWLSLGAGLHGFENGSPRGRSGRLPRVWCMLCRRQRRAGQAWSRLVGLSIVMGIWDLIYTSSEGEKLKYTCLAEANRS